MIKTSLISELLKSKVTQTTNQTLEIKELNLEITK